MSLVSNIGIGKCAFNFLYDLNFDRLDDNDYLKYLTDRWKTVGLWPTDEELMAWAHNIKKNVTKVQPWLKKTDLLILNGSCVWETDSEEPMEYVSVFYFLYIKGQRIQIDSAAEMYVQRLIDTGLYEISFRDHQDDFILSFKSSV